MGSIYSPKGFTIIEVSIVIAISGFLLVSMLTGIGIAVERQRFTDTVFSTQGHIQDQFNRVSNVINNRDNGRRCSNPNVVGVGGVDIGSDPCIILGRALVFLYDTANRETIIKSYVVIGQNSVSDVNNKSSLDTIKETNPYVYGDSSSNGRFVLPWGGSIQNLKEKGTAFSPPTPTSTMMIAILRSPRDGSVAMYTLKNNLGATPSDADNSLVKINENSFYWRRVIDVSPASSAIERLNNDLVACIKSSSLVVATASLVIKPTGSQDGVGVFFDEESDATGACA